MRRLVFLAICVMMCGSVASATSIYPEVTYEGFDPATFTYTYRIDCTVDSTFPFGQLIVQAKVPNFGVYFPWALGADGGSLTPLYNTALWAKSTQVRLWVPTRMDNAIWRAPTTDDVVPSNTVWSGRFTLVVPNSAPTGGLVVTMDGGPISTAIHEREVPGPAMIPEPSSLLALGGLVGGLLPLVRRRKK